MSANGQELLVMNGANRRTLEPRLGLFLSRMIARPRAYQVDGGVNSQLLNALIELRYCQVCA